MNTPPIKKELDNKGKESKQCSFSKAAQLSTKQSPVPLEKGVWQWSQTAAYLPLLKGKGRECIEHHHHHGQHYLHSFWKIPGQSAIGREWKTISTGCPQAPPIWGLLWPPTIDFKAQWVRITPWCNCLGQHKRMKSTSTSQLLITWLCFRWEQKCPQSIFWLVALSIIPRGRKRWRLFVKTL